MSQPSRQDIHQLLTGYAGFFFDQECLSPITNRLNCDIRTSDTIQEGLLQGTRGLLLLGDRAFKQWTTSGLYDSYTLNEQRGCPLSTPYAIPCLCSYSPQDCVDLQDYESTHNPLLQTEADERGGHESDEDEYAEKRRHGRTSRSNYRHWLRADTKKILYAISGGATSSAEGSFEKRIYPREEEVLDILNSSSGQYLYLDIETDSDFNMLCFGFNLSNSNTVCVVPCLRYDYRRAYSSLTRILRALVLAMQRNTVVIHNSMFDLFVLAWKYKLYPPRHIYDTMIAQHRMFPVVEKSLGHCLTSWPTIWEPFHKDEGVFMPWNLDQEKQLWTYNAKDVYGMRLIHEAQMRYVDAGPNNGLRESIAQGMRSIKPFLLMSLQGIKFDDTLRQSIIKDNDILLTHYLRAIRMLVGPTIDLLPTSSPSCIKYFHEALGYPIVGRSKKTGNPSLDETNLLKLKLKNPHNVVIDFCIKYRERVKESGMLGFEPWIKE